MFRLAVVLTAVSLLAPFAAAQQELRIEDLGWLAGCWRSEDAGKLSEECWLPPRAGGMVGVNRTSGQERYAFEFLRIAQDDDGVVFWASPSGKTAVPFRATEISGMRVVFANPEHDFPQRLTYWREGDRLQARVEAQSNGEWDGFVLSWVLSADGWNGAPDASTD